MREGQLQTALRSLLSWYRLAGVDTPVSSMPRDRLVEHMPATPSSAATNHSRVKIGPMATAPVAPSGPDPVPGSSSGPAVPEETLPAALRDSAADAETIAAACRTLAELRAAVEGFDACALKRTALHTVFADGAEDAPLMAIGEAPGADEDRIGRPFVGASGKLLDRMLAEIGVSRDRNIYITNVFFWRPPGNRKPTPVETAQCLPFVRRHIRLKRPRILIALGATAVQALLGIDKGITRLRGRWLTYHDDELGEVPLLPVFHPAYLLRQPQGKAQFWRDLLTLRDKLQEVEP
ncbi:MAG: uracil-DNA glycosylase [Alphaproteobacteria bacterium]|nr:MAG: uracil-DNA glycosylase [Alphaproteobacteria bacterium]